MNQNLSTSPWNEERLNELIRDKVEESSNLDYKACDALQKTDGRKREISKDVSAFANSSGGVIVYGMIEENHYPKRIDDGFDPNDITKEWLEHVINGNIRPRIPGVRIHPVELSTTNPGRVAYIVEIFQSATAHQAADKKYYRRYNFESVAMEDYEIRDVMNRRKNPLLVPYITCKDVEIRHDHHVYELEIVLKNEGELRAIDVKFIVYFPTKMIVKTGSGYSDIRTLSADTIIPEFSGQAYDLSELVIKRGAFVIFPGDEWRITDEGKYKIKYEVTHDIFTKWLHTYSPSMYWKIFADDAPPKMERIEMARLYNF